MLFLLDSRCEETRGSISVTQNLYCVWSYGVRMARQKSTVFKRVRRNQHNRICANKYQAETKNGYDKINASRQSSLRYRVEMEKLEFRKSHRGCCTEESKSSKVATINRSEETCHITALGFALLPSAASAPGVAAGNTAVLPRSDGSVLTGTAVPGFLSAAVLRRASRVLSDHVVIECVL
jgi:hypothetical protein